jgi:prophage antirepressor-like protein
MSNLTIFNNKEFGTVRTIEENGKVIFCGTDVALSLGYTNPQKAIKDHCKKDGVTFRSVIDSMGRTQQAKFISEGNLYRLISHSKLPSAEMFEKWIFDEVIPSIRQHGLYATDKLLNDPDLAIAAFTALKKEREKAKALEDMVAIQNQQIVEMKPKASYYDLVLNCKDLVAISVIAKDYGWSAKRMNSYLKEKGVQFKQGSIWLLYQKYAELGYTSTKTHSYNGNDGTIHTKPHTYWTQKGRLFIYSLLKADGILPMIEKEEA